LFGLAWFVWFVAYAIMRLELESFFFFSQTWKYENMRIICRYANMQCNCMRNLQGDLSIELKNLIVSCNIAWYNRIFQKLKFFFLIYSDFSQ
jgi:hypothetical protein